jgi:hypothetical protein
VNCVKEIGEDKAFFNKDIIVAESDLNISQDHSSVDTYRSIKRGIWIYFLLLIFEGALRKWFLPGISTPLLIVRDPVALWIIFSALSRNLLPKNSYLSVMIAIGTIGIFTAIFLGHGNLRVALYGARIFLLHFPLMFVIGKVFNKNDVLKMGRVLVYMAIPMAILTALQFYSPQSAWINRGVGGDESGAGFSGALGFFRPPATFSFTNGNTLFFGLVACLIIYFWLTPKSINRIILLTATIGLLAAIPLSISRSLFYSVGVSFMFAVFFVIRKPKYFGKMLMSTGLIILVFVLMNKTAFFQTAAAAFSARFDGATEWEGGVSGSLGNRYLGNLAGSLIGAFDAPFFGYGLGAGTSIGGVLLYGSQGLIIAEDEWARTIIELGPLMGLAAIFVRVGFCAKIAIAGYRKLVLGDVLPWMLLSFGLITVPQCQWAQPTALGFSTLIGGLMIASFNDQIFNDPKTDLNYTDS